MSRYRKKPVEVDAWHVTDWSKAPPWAKGALHFDPVLGNVIRTLEGDMKVAMYDYVIRGVQGEVYPCKRDIFEATYEPVFTSDKDG